MAASSFTSPGGSETSPWSVSPGSCNRSYVVAAMRAGIIALVLLGVLALIVLF